jgi:plastocyanin
MVTRRFLAICAAAGLAVSACGGGSGAQPLATCSPNGVSPSISAANSQFSVDCLAVRAHQRFTIAFDNKDAGVQHNVRIYSTNGQTLFLGAITTGTKTVTYDVAALKPGTYRFHCDVHPDSMQGTFIVK